MARTVYGVFKVAGEANAAVSQLMGAGFTKDDISAIARDNVKVTEEVDTTSVADNVADGATTGAVAGGTVGALAGLLVGIGIIVLPPIGGLVIAGPLALALGISYGAASTLSGGAIGALSGGLIGGLVGLGLPEEDARYYEEVIKNEGVLLTVTVNDVADEKVIQDVFARNNAEKVRIA